MELVDTESNSTTKMKNMSAGATGGDGSDSITSALNNLKSKADEVIGQSSEDSEDGEGVIGQFGQLKTAVDNVTTSIGSTEGTDTSTGDESTLIGSIDTLLLSIAVRK